MLVALAFVQDVVGSDAVLGWAGVDELGDPGAAPLFLLGIGVPMAGLALVSAWVSRRNEREADPEALELLGDPSSFVARRSEEHTSELKSLMGISYAVFGVKKTPLLTITLR